VRGLALIAPLFISPLLVAKSVVAEGVHWGYGESDGPALWHTLHPSFEICRDGRQQSPIDLGAATTGQQIPLEFSYAPGQLRIARHEHVVDILNNGHTIQVDYDEGSTLTVRGVSYELVQYHFHAPSEHTVDGLPYAMEMHLVHQAEDGRLLVVGVLIEPGAYNSAFEPVWRHLPREVGEAKHLEHVVVNIDDLLPAERSSVRYMGSLTTPPCSEGVKWLVMAKPVSLSVEQIRAFTSIVQGNNRPIQPLNDRATLKILGAR
jgi:carbonic anhydrase